MTDPIRECILHFDSLKVKFNEIGSLDSYMMLAP